jgi:hypothetical protein
MAQVLIINHGMNIETKGLANGIGRCLITQWTVRHFLAPLLGLILGVSAGADPATAEYKLITIQGYTVHVHPSIARNHPLAHRMELELQHKFSQLALLLSPPQLAFMHSIQFWVEMDKAETAMMFHPSREWLVQNGYNPDKAHGIEISNVRHFLQWVRADQPMMVLHELAHAYLFLVLKEDFPPLETAWLNAHARHLYESVPYVHGGLRTAYARTDKQEFFAELSEAYFGKNDFFPFTSEELRRYDPVSFKLMQQAWGPKPSTALSAL